MNKEMPMFTQTLEDMRNSRDGTNDDETQAKLEAFLTSQKNLHKVAAVHRTSIQDNPK